MSKVLSTTHCTYYKPLCKFTFIMFHCESTKPFFFKYTNLLCTFCCDEHFCEKLWWNWWSIYSWKIFTSNWCTHDFYYGRTTYRSCRLKPMAQAKSSIDTKLLIWNHFKLVFAISWNWQKELVCFCICL